MPTQVRRRWRMFIDSHDHHRAMQDHSTDENYFTEEGLEKSTESLMSKLEHAKDPDAYREHFHNHIPSSRRDEANPARASTVDSLTPQQRQMGLLITLLSICAGAFAGVLLSAYLL